MPTATAEVWTQGGVNYIQANGPGETDIYYEFTALPGDDGDNLISAIDVGNGFFQIETTQGVDYVKGVPWVMFESPWGGGHITFSLTSGMNFHMADHSGFTI